MTTFTEIVAAVVVHSSAVALSHFGVTMEPAQIERTPAPAERVIARTPTQHKAVRLTNCPTGKAQAHVVKA
jgi:hypothetical protein